MNRNSLLTIFTKNPRYLFLLDGLGAVLSAFLLGVVLVRFITKIGMPVDTLYWLASIPCFFAVYDFSCYLIQPKNWPFYLAVIAVANLMYCLFSAGLLFHHAEQLTTLGWLYFITEIMIVLLLSIYELRVART